MGGNYAATGQGTTGTNKTILGLTAAATVRPALFYFAVGSAATPADQAGVFELKRFTAAGTSTDVTPKPFEPADPAALCTAGENHSVEPTYTAAGELWSTGINQRATLQWWAYNDNGRIILPATAANGVGLKTSSHTGTPTADATFHWTE